jgi:regulation of enolase protein 1 (concanavalin A-like superfamily)
MRYLLGLAVILVLSCSMLRASEPKEIFAEGFDGKLAKQWTWLRENPQAWRIQDKALEIRVEPGTAGDVKNALLLAAPDRGKAKFAIEVTVTFTADPTNQYEQAGITWYQKDKPVFKLVHELVNGKVLVVPGAIPEPEKKVQLRLVVSKDEFVAQYRANGEGEFKTVAKAAQPPASDEKVSIQCYNGPKDAEHWIRFDDFRILQLPE